MAVLAFDTATAATVVGLLEAGGALTEARHDPPPGGRPEHAQRLLPLVHQVVEDWDAVARIGVGLGPGSFTGLRIGIATARALAQGRGVPVVGVGTLAVVARRLSDDFDGTCLAVLDARRGEVFAAMYRHHRTTMEPGVFPPAELAERVAARREWGRSPMLGVGDGAVRFRAELERSGVAVPSDGSPAHRVSALMICRLGREREPVDRDSLLPDYRREPDAVPPSRE